LKIDESGLHALVNKFIRNRMATQERALPFEEAKTHEENAKKAQETDYDDATFDLLFKDELQEREIARIILEHGTKFWDDHRLIAEYIISEMIDESLLDNPEIANLIDVVKKQIQLDPQSLGKNYFVYHPDRKLSALAVSLLNFPYEESERWKREYSEATGYQKQLFDLSYEQFIQTVAPGNEQQLMSFLKMDEDNTHVQVESGLTYLKLRKVKRMMIENQLDLEKSQITNEERQVLDKTHEHLKDMEVHLMKTHEHLKELQRKITEKTGTVILR
jgi:DNA primase